MVELDDAAIADYVASGEWRGKAGALRDAGHRAALVARGARLGDQRDRAAARRGARGAARGRRAVRGSRAGRAGVTGGRSPTRWRAVRARVDAACERAGRAPAEVTIVAVSKTHPAEAVREAAAAGATDFGENYAQELAAKRAEVAPARRALALHRPAAAQQGQARRRPGRAGPRGRLASSSRDRARQARRGRRGAADPARGQRRPARRPRAASTPDDGGRARSRDRSRSPDVRLDGLMTMPPPADDPEASRPYFRALRALRDRLADARARRCPCCRWA